MYDRSADIYDLLYVGLGIKDYAAESATLQDLISSYSPNAQTLLDVACGTGAHLAHLRSHYQVEGLDLSPAMLSAAKARLPGVPLHVADMRTLSLPRRFDVILCLFSSIGYVLDSRQMHATVARFASHLNPLGLLILDGWVRPEAWHDDYLPSPEIASNGDTTVVRLAANRRSGSITTLDMHHLVRTPLGIEHFSEVHALALVPTADYVAAMEQANLQSHVISDYMPGRDRILGLKP